ncbi:RNA polymerase sigma-70 factor (ECF subfamily) [Thermonema lapsum]|uniref:RNA polymerase sigma-70 factor (ECF subfamily) n=1 Tax=Thermonema lapsum TaxID=28195 RepID=A0A846MSN8_9BACT|nr:sigma-70 family RNA polymerase sigma factor [Thermonema lapsum]NIK74267.1 RNA polymerase sigma-70 factor (ECF subfamily) [Thermonema lapsum]
MIRLRKRDVTTDEASLLAAVRKGNEKAMSALYERHAAKMMAVCRRYLPMPEAEDAFLEGFQRVFQHIEQYKGEGNFEGWMRRIFVNQCLQYLRRKSLLLTIETEGTDALADELQLPEEALSQLEAEYLMKLLERLPKGCRTVFNLYAIEGFTHAEIASMLNISEGTSKSQLAKARKMLQSWIIEETQCSQIKSL